MTLGLIIRDGSNTPRTVSELVIRDASNTPRDISELWIRDVNNVPRLVFNPSGSATLAATITPTNVSGQSAGTGTATTATVTATATGGTPPYTYLWELLTYTADVEPTAVAPTSAITAFTQTSMDPGGVYFSDWQLTVTDDNSVSAIASPTISALFADTT